MYPAKNEQSVQPQQTDDGAAQPDVVYAHVIPVDTPAPAEAASLNHPIYANLQSTSDYNNQINDLYAKVRPQPRLAAVFWVAPGKSFPCSATLDH